MVSFFGFFSLCAAGAGVGLGSAGVGLVLVVAFSLRTKSNVQPRQELRGVSKVLTLKKNYWSLHITSAAINPDLKH